MCDKYLFINVTIWEVLLSAWVGSYFVHKLFCRVEKKKKEGFVVAEEINCRVYEEKER